MNAVPLPPEIAEAFRKQEKACLALGSPFTAAICALVANRGVPAGPVHDRLAGWTGDPDGTADALALRLTGALHSLVLGARDRELAEVYPPNTASAAVLESSVLAAIKRHGDYLARFLDSPPQTNETGRSALLLPAFLWLQGRFGIPFILSEIGSSAGLNQNWNRYRYEYGRWSWGNLESPVTLACEWRGGTPPGHFRVNVEGCAGCDIAPVDIAEDENRLRLKSYVWPDQPARLARLTGALALAKRYPPAVEKRGAAQWLETRLAERRPYRLHVVFHTIMWNYMPANEQARAQDAIEEAGRQATSDAPLAWLRFEADNAPDGAAITLTTWAGRAMPGETAVLGRGDYHGRWIDWRSPG